MSDHNFETQVRQKLNNLKLPPSPEAWENIEEKLRAGRRRRPIIWLPLILAGIIAAGYFIFNPEIDKAPKTSETMVRPDKSQKNNTGEGLTTIQNPRTANSQSTALSPAIGAIANGLTGTSVNIVKTMGRQKPLINNPLKNNRFNTYNKKDAAIRKEFPVAADEKSIDKISEDNEDKIADQQEISDKKNTADSGKNSFEKNLALSQSPTNQKPTTKPLPVNRKNSKWSFALTGSGGISGENEGNIFAINKPKVEDVAFTTNFAGTVVNYAPVYKPSTIMPSIGYSGGVEVKRELSKRFSISAGLNYMQLNTRVKVGDRINSPNVVNNGARGYLFVQSYYYIDQNEKKEHINRYNFIEIPVSLHTRLNNSLSLPVYWNAGVVVSRLLSSTSLHFDGTTGVYYKNDRLLNQTQAAVTTGFSFALFNKTNHPLWIGPSARSNISSILKRDISSNRHFAMLGLDVKWFLKK